MYFSKDFSKFTWTNIACVRIIPTTSWNITNSAYSQYMISYILRILSICTYLVHTSYSLIMCILCICWSHSAYSTKAPKWITCSNEIIFFLSFYRYIPSKFRPQRTRHKSFYCCDLTQKIISAYSDYSRNALRIQISWRKRLNFWNQLSEWMKGQGRHFWRKNRGQKSKYLASGPLRSHSWQICYCLRKQKGNSSILFCNICRFLVKKYRFIYSTPV